MIAGHDTTANTLCWMLYELSCQADIQNKLRIEIRQKIAEKGDSPLDEKDFEGMPLLISIVKASTLFHFTGINLYNLFVYLQETLRLHPIGYMLHRESSRDDVLPLSTPVTLTNGKIVNELPIPKGQKIIASLCSYNRHVYSSRPHQ
jgi:cytochrome P450